MELAPNSRPASARHAGIHAVIRSVRVIWESGRVDLKARIVLALAALVLAKIVNAVVPFFYKSAVDALTADGAVATAIVAVPVVMILAYGFARFGSVALNELRDGVFARVSQHAVRTIARRTFEHLHDLSLRFHLERRTGGLGRVMERGSSALENIVEATIFNIVPTIIELAFVATILAVYLDPWFSVILLVSVAAYVWFTFRLTEWRVKIRREMNEADSDAYAKAVDSLLNYETVKYFGNERHETERFDVAMADYEKAAVRTTVSLSLLNAGQSAIFTAGMVACMVLAGFGVADGRMTVGDFVLVNAYLIQVYVPLNFLGMVHRIINQGLVDLERLYALMAERPEVVDPPDARALTVAGGEVRFEGVDFSYDPARRILKGVTLTVESGRTLAIVGPSGAGKSTIARLLYRFYDASSGRITIDGQDLRDVTQASLRAAIGMVPQDTVLFNDTIGYNIRYGRPEASDGEVERAAMLAQIHDFVASLPDGYETLVGERGLKLSGGEKQRVAIARTILKGPPILILDEATSALDSFTEKDIQSALKTVAEGRTTLVIAHRLSTIADADEIVVLDEGSVVERGSHRELLAAGGLYASLWERQQEAAKAEARLRAAEGVETATDGPARPAVDEVLPRPSGPEDWLEQVES